MAPMGAKDIVASLDAASAKVWPRARADEGTSLLIDDQLMVPRWRDNGQLASSPRAEELEIKGALLRPDMTECVPEYKRDRSCQIHRFGFT